MPCDMIYQLGAFMPIAASADSTSIASALDRLADLALATGRARFAEYLAHRATQLREAEQ